MHSKNHYVRISLVDESVQSNGKVKFDQPLDWLSFCDQALCAIDEDSAWYKHVCIERGGRTGSADLAPARSLSADGKCEH